MNRMTRTRNAVIARHGENPPADHNEALNHSPAVHADTTGTDMAVTAAANIFGPGVRTGLTFGDLRDIREDLETASQFVAAAAPSDDDEDPMSRVERLLRSALGTGAPGTANSAGTASTPS
ncbi:hypothetical protein ABT218_18345 [Streptomyces sp. NPDC001455]|uniref:hypothetical protein n=1 Tax=Streptomyces sp. NPDC001455 TaxID=3154518 RepID=UPI0033267DE7